MSTMSRSGLPLALAVALGCGSNTPAVPPPDAKKIGIPADEIPASIMDVAKKELGDVTVKDTFKKTKADGTTLLGYEVRGQRKSDGKILEVMVAPDGRIVEKEGF